MEFVYSFACVAILNNAFIDLLRRKTRPFVPGNPFLQDVMQHSSLWAYSKPKNVVNTAPGPLLNTKVTYFFQYAICGVSAGPLL